MAKYIFKISILNKKNHNPLSIVAYYSGQTQIDLFKKNKFNPDPKKKVLYSNLFVPQKIYNDLPDYLKINNKKKDIVDNARNALWKSIDSFETRIDSQFARLFEVSIPFFFTQEQANKLVTDFSNELTECGMICDTSIHKTNNQNYNIFGAENTLIKNLDQDYSCYFLCTLRSFENGVFTNKNRDWNSKDQLIAWRQQWLMLLKLHIEKNPANEDDKKVWEKMMSNYKNEEKIIDIIPQHVEAIVYEKQQYQNSKKILTKL